jgi:hypothetical protein
MFAVLNRSSSDSEEDYGANTSIVFILSSLVSALTMGYGLTSGSGILLVIDLEGCAYFMFNFFRVSYSSSSESMNTVFRLVF